MNKLEKEAIETVRSFWRLNSLRGNKNYLKALEMLHPNFMGFGSTRIENYQNAEIFKKSLKKEFSENPEGFSFSFPWIDSKQISEEIVQVCAHISFDVNTSTGILPIDLLRFSCLLVKVGSSFKIIQIHGSKPEELGVENELWPGSLKPKLYDNISILFTDFVGFTEMSSQLSPELLVEELNELFYHFDLISASHDILKIKTIGDAYMAVSGFLKQDDDHARSAICASLEMQAYLKEKNLHSALTWKMRTGVHSGPVVGGLIGRSSRVFDIWGDNVNIASRIESNGGVGQINISQSTYEMLKDDPDFKFESRGKIEAKGKGEIEMYFVSKA